MNFRHVGAVYRKELLDTLRDRRTLIWAILVPILLYPALMLVLAGVVVFTTTRATEKTQRVVLLNAEEAPELAWRIRTQHGLEVVRQDRDYVRQINERRLQAAVEFPRGLRQRLEGVPQQTQVIRIHFYRGEIRSRSAARTLERIVEEYGKEQATRLVTQHGVDPKVLRPFPIERKSAASAEKVTGNVLGFLLPYMIIFVCLTGTTYSALDLTAGEKERGTMETILASPVRRIDLVLGKFLLTVTVALTTAALAVASFALSVLGGADLFAQLSGGLVAAVSVKAVSAVFFVVVPLAILFSGGLMAVTVYARSYREAQGYLGPLLFFVILPALLTMIPGVRLTPRLALVPIANVSLVAREVLAGNYPWEMIILVFLSTLGLAGMALILAAWQFSREEVLFRT